MSSISITPSDDAVDLIDTLYDVLFDTPGVGTFISFYALFRKAIVDQKYTGELGEKYASRSDKYFVRITYPEICCRIVPGLGHIVLFGLQIYKKWKGSQLLDQALKEPEHAITLLKESVKLYRHVDSIYLLAIYYRDGIGVTSDPEMALSYFKEAEAAGDRRSSIAIGNLYLCGLGQGSNSILQDSQKAIDSYRRGNAHDGSSLSKFAKYREEFVKVLLELSFMRDKILPLIARSKGRFDTDFSDESHDLALHLATAFKEGRLEPVFHYEAEKLYQCAATYLPDGPLKAETYYKLALCTHNWSDYEKAATLGWTQAAFDLSLLKREASKKKENQERAAQLLSEAFHLLASVPQEVVKKDYALSIQLGHFYLGLGCGTPQFDQAIECYKFCLDMTVVESEKGPLHYLIEFAAILKEVYVNNPEQFGQILTFFHQDGLLWEHLPSKGVARLPLLLGQQFLNGQQLKKDMKIAEKLFELCSRQRPDEMKATAFYGLSQIEQQDLKKCRVYLEDCIRFDPKHLQARLALYSLIKEVDRKEADTYLQPLIDERVPEAFYLKGLTFLSDADKIAPPRQKFAFGHTPTAEELQKTELLKKAREHLETAAHLGHPQAQALFRQQFKN